MAFFPLLSFVALLLFGSVSSWAGCSGTTRIFARDACSLSNAPCCTHSEVYYPVCHASCSVLNSGSIYYAPFGDVIFPTGNFCGSSIQNDARVNAYICDNKCSADSVACLQNPNAMWDSQNCKCGAPTPPPDEPYYQCQNSGGPEEGGFGSPRKALLFKCIEDICTQTASLAGTCQDWGFCDDGVDDCRIPSSKGDPPCGRSGSGFTSSTKCYYACADGSGLSCTPISTQYVAGSKYVGECPDNPPDACRPASSSSGGSSSSGSDSGSSSSSYSPAWSSDSVPPDTVTLPNGQQIDYTPILNAIKDTLHRANVQRDFLTDLQIAANNSFDIVANYSEYNYSKLSNIATTNSSISGSASTTATATTDINNRLSTLQENGFSLVSETAEDISTSRELLDEINRYLRSDSLYTALPLDTVYNPLLRDIKGAIDSINTGHDTTRFVRDSAFARWFAAYYSDTAGRAGILGDIYENTKTLAGDSSKNSSCAAFLSCYTPNPTFANAQACAVSTGGSLESCVDGGSPLDNLVNVELGVLKTLWNGFFGSDSTVTDTESSDTNVVFSPAKDSATNSMMGAIRALFSSDSTASILNKVKEMKDSIEKRNNDSTVIQPDSLVLDSSEAAQYVQNLLLVPGTSEDCFICHADLGTFGGLVPNGLSIHIDFADFGGFNFCALIRAVVKIASLVVCISLTLGSWLAAFGYNPKNDA